MKNQHIYRTLIIIGFVILIALACEPDKPVSPGNQLNGKTAAIFNPEKTYGIVIDIDRNIYKTIVIGDQTWMAENLRTTRYQNGDTLPNVTDNTQWEGLTTGAYCNYNNTNSLDTIATYGRLYNYYAVADSRKLAPKGWRVPNTEDWNTQIEYLGGDTIASFKMKETGNTHWGTPSESNNSSGFTALPAGSRYPSEGFDDHIGFYTAWWATSVYNDTSATFLFLLRWNAVVYKGVQSKQNGYSIRLIKETN